MKYLIEELLNYEYNHIYAGASKTEKITGIVIIAPNFLLKNKINADIFFRNFNNILCHKINKKFLTIM
jgi:hypothetical protein